MTRPELMWQHFEEDDVEERAGRHALQRPYHQTPVQRLQTCQQQTNTYNIKINYIIITS